jgi:aryl-alcohol dehydrogenase-like predicted oxidoreductase
MRTVPRAVLAPGYTVSRVIKGGWQLAGGHGAVDRAAAIADMHAFVDAGITTFDCADIYTGVEALIGEFVRERGRDAVQIHTKYVPDRSRLRTLTRREVADAVGRALRRLRVDAVDLVQFHWWDYDAPGAADALAWLDEHRRAGRVRHLGVTNFDTAALAGLLDLGVAVVSHQVQYSVLDQRPAATMTALCRDHGVQLLCYGALAGGFLSERYLGAAAPVDALENRSLVKYRLIIDEIGGWSQLQRVLQALAAVARRHDTTLGAVAVAWTLHQPKVAAAIVGARHARHLPATVAAASLVLDAGDLAALGAAIGEHRVPGDVYAAERAKDGRHAAVMRYELNAEPAE